jgi:putrescine aminotransferase
MTTAAGAVTDTAAIYRRHLSSGKVRIAELLGNDVEISSRGSLVMTESGREMLDCGGYGVFLLGHCHPRVVEAVRQQLERLPLVTRMLLEPAQAHAAQALARLAPEGLDRVYFGTSGADVVEAAIKLARLNGKRRLIGVTGGFHGKTLGALSVCGNPIVRDPFTPLLPDTEKLPFGDAAALHAALARAPGECCVILEPILGEGGVQKPPTGYIAAAAEASAQYDALLIIDEIATGLGRTGLLWECEREGVTPDMLLVGKALSGGVVPVGAVVASDAAYAPFDRDPHIHSATFAGAAIAMAAVGATIAVIEEDDVPRLAQELGRALLEGLREALSDGIDSGYVRDLRGSGLLIGIEFDSPKSAGEFEIELMSRRVIPNHCLNHHAVVRLTPSVYMSASQVHWLCDAARGACAAVSGQRQRRAAARAAR